MSKVKPKRYDLRACNKDKYQHAMQHSEFGEFIFYSTHLEIVSKLEQQLKDSVPKSEVESLLCHWSERCESAIKNKKYSLLDQFAAKCSVLEQLLEGNND